MANKSSTTESTKNIITLLVLLLAYPIGIIVMWYWTKWEKWVKWLVTVPIFLLIFGGVFIGLVKSLDLNTQIRKGTCAEQCANSKLKNMCLDQCMSR